MTHEEKIRFTDRCLWEYIGENPDNQVIENPNWFQVITKESSNVMANGVFRCTLPENEIDRKIAECIATYEEFKLPFHWIVSPSSRPLDLPKRLEKAGMELADITFGVFANPKDIHIPKAPDVTVQSVCLDHLDQWQDILERGWPLPRDSAMRLRKQVEHQILHRQDWVNHFIAFFDGAPAGIVQLRFQGDYAYMLGGTVVPEHRKHGIFSTMISHINHVTLKKDFQVLVGHARKSTSAPIFLSFGYEKTSELLNYYWRQPRKDPKISLKDLMTT